MSSVPATFLLFYGWLVLVPAVDQLLWKRCSWRDLFAAFGLILNRRNIFAGGALGVCFLLMIILGGYFFHSSFFDQADLKQLLERWNFSGNLVVWLIVILMFINPVLEEVYWRGYVYQKLAGTQNPKMAIFLTSLCYSLYHLLSVIPLFAWPYNLMMVIPVFFAGMMWGYMRHLHRSLWGSIASHILADMGIMAVYLLFLA